MELTIKNFEEMNLYSNKTLQKVASSLVNESSNAVLVNMFDDACLLLDHKVGQFYLADYNFNQKDATFTFENFEPISLTKNSNNFKDAVKTYFEDEETTTSDLIESYKNNIVGQDSFITDLVTEAMVEKNYDEIVDYSVLSGINESVEVKDEKFFSAYKERLSTHPLTSIKMFNWKDPIKVSLIETESTRKPSVRIMEMAKDLWKKDGFKAKFGEAASAFVEDVENGAELFKNLLEEYPGIFYLDNLERKSLFGKTIISNPSLREDRTEIVKGIELLFEKFDLSDMKEEMINEGKLTKGNEGDAAVDTEDGEAEEEPSYEMGKDEVGKLIKEVEKLKSKAEDLEDETLKGKLVDKLEKIISDLEGSKDTGGDAKAVKEAVEILSL